MKTAEEFYRDIEPLIENEWYQAAICAFEQLLNAYPGFARGHHELGTLHYKYGDKDNTLECYKKSVEYDPDNMDYLKNLADYYHVELEQVEPALAVYKNILEKCDNDVDTLFITGNLSLVMHNFEDAKNYYRKVLRIEPWHAEAFEYLEKIKNHQSEDSKTVSPDEMHQKAHEAGAAGDVESAISTLEQLIRQNPDHAVAHNDLGAYHSKLGHTDQALNHYLQAVRLEPFNTTFEKNLADFYYAVNQDLAEALKIYLNVLKRDPEDTEVLLAAGHISREVNRLQNAEMFYSRVMEIEPWNLEASENLNSLKMQMKQPNSAGF